jgi:hypothetical protein
MNFDFFRFCSVLRELLATGLAFGVPGGAFEAAHAWSSGNSLATLRNLCLRIKSKRTLEVGMCFGASALVFTSSHRELHCEPNRQHLALDPFQTSVWDDAGLFARWFGHRTRDRLELITSAGFQIFRIVRPRSLAFISAGFSPGHFENLVRLRDPADFQGGRGWKIHASP